MPEFVMPYFEAVKRWNLGGTSWCLPRKGTPGYETVMAIRRGEPAKSREETVAEIVKEKKSSRKKRVRVTQTVSLERQQEEMPQEETVTVPTYEEKPKKKTIRIPKRKDLKTFEVGYTDKYRTDKFEQALQKYKDSTIEPALRHYQEYITEVNKVRKTPIRTVHFKVQDELDFDKVGNPPTGRKMITFNNTSTAGYGYERSSYVDLSYIIEPKFIVDPKDTAKYRILGSEYKKKE